MSAERRPASTRYDALVDLLVEDHVARRAYALVKLSYAVGGGRCERAEARPLEKDFRDPECKPPLPPGTDFWPYKERPDFAVRGVAYAPDGQPVTRMRVKASVGRREKAIEVFGDRPVRWRAPESLRFEPPEPFESMPLVWERAYGGLDWRAPLPEPLSPAQQFLLQSDHPGLYPRNPWGRGYLTEAGEVPDFLLPNLEDPSDLLAPERLVTGDPRAWWRQPLPWTFEWLSVGTFPRYLTLGLGADAWYPAPDDAELPEVRRGWLRPDWRSYYEEGPSPHTDLFQEASHGLTLDFDPFGAPVVLEGMHPERPELRFDLPREKPSVEFELEGRSRKVEPRLHHAVCHPDEELVTLTYGAVVDLPRAFVPGVHREIPVALRVDGDEPIPFPTPTPVREEIEAARAQSSEDES